jgi:hypothetical protein
MTSTLTPEEQKVADLESALESERVEFTAKMNELIPMLNRIDKISEAQVLMLSYRHMMVDKLIRYRAAGFKKKSNDQNFKKIRYEYYKTQHDIRLDYREINDFIASDMSLRIRQTDLLENQINFYSQCIETLDKMGYSIKNKISIEEMNDRKNL